tara:strand:+ start:626 stop:1138 length:513 start_codon:yes stop_codon:yes gene_type:complete
MIKLKDILTEKYEIDLVVGDTILRGKFKNKPVVVKEFGVDDKGQPTVNGKKMLSFRIKKLIPAKASVKEGKAIPMDTPNEFAYQDFKKYAYKGRSMFKKEMLKHKGDSSRMFMTLSALWYKWSRKSAPEFTHIKNKLKFGRALMVMMVKDNLIFDKSAWKKDNQMTHVKN